MSLELKSLTRETEILRSRTFFTRVENKVKAFLTNLILCFFSIHTVVMANLCSMPLHLNIMSINLLRKDEVPRLLSIGIK